MKFNYTQTLLIYLLCINNFLLLKIGLKIMLKNHLPLDLLAVVNDRQPIKVEMFHSATGPRQINVKCTFSKHNMKEAI